MIKTHKIKMYPNATMRLVLTRLFAYRRYCYNQALEIWNEMYDASVVMADKTLLQQAYQQVTRIQEDLLHKFTAQLIHTNDVVVIEDLDNLHMRMNKHLAKNLHRSMFGKFKVLMQYKRAWHGVKLVMADRFYPSTQRCSKCGFVKTGADKVGLAGNQIHRTGHDDYVCYECGAVMRRDQNAVENLIQYAEVN